MSYPDAPDEITALMKCFPQSAAELKIERHTKQIDKAYFRAHPGQESYVRPFHRGEVSGLLWLACKQQPVSVAVGFVAGGERIRVFLFPGMLHATGRHWAEEAAERERVRMGLRGRA
ncbi:hypothetical protein [Deinococcus sp.]|uniref:hypothetical protein n=1 Tax=Deinococcus sp. TaxID=47478 RepID=UPI003C7C9051